MAKGDNDIEFLDSSVSAIFDATIDLKATSEKHLDELKGIKKSYEDAAKKYNEGQLNIKQFVKEISNYTKEVRNLVLDIKNTNKSNQRDRGFEERLVKALELNTDGKISPEILDRIMTTISNVEVSGIMQSKKEEEKGGKNPVFKNIDSDKVKSITSEVVTKLDLKIDNFQDKIMTFFGDMNQQNQKKQKGLIEYLIEGLANNRFIGGAMRDTVRLFGLLGAGWLAQHFGKLGKVLGSILYVMSEVLPGAIGQMMLNSFQGIAQGLGQKIAEKLLEGVKALGVGNVLKMGAGAAVAGTSALIGGYGIAEGVDSWREGRKGLGASLVGSGTGVAVGGAALGTGLVASGLSSAAMGGGLTALGVAAGPTGVAALLSTIAGALTPIGGILLGISAVVLGLSLFWKAFGDDISKYFRKLFNIKDKEQKDKEAHAEKFWGDIGGSGGKISGTSWTTPNNSGGVTYHGSPSWATGGRVGGGVKATYGRMKVAPDGSVLNFHELTQAEGARSLLQYQQSNPGTFKNVFEFVDPRYVQAGSIMTDQAIKKNGKLVGLPLYAGATSDLLGARKVASSYIGGRSNRLVFSSGIGGKGGPHHLRNLANIWKSHFSPYGAAFDLVYNQGTLEDYKKSYRPLQEFYRKKGFDLQYENPDGSFAKTIDQMKAGGHFDVKRLKKDRPIGALKNEGITVNSEQQSIKPTETKKEEKKNKQKDETKVKAEVPVTQPLDNAQRESTPMLNSIAQAASTVDIMGNATFSKVQQTLGTIVLSGPDQIRV